MLKKNVSGQSIYFELVNLNSGLFLTSGIFSGYVGIDKAAQAAVAGSFTELGFGQYRFNPFAADTNGDCLGYAFLASGAVPVGANFQTFTVLESGAMSVSGVFVQSGIATAVQVSGISTGFAFVSGVFVQSAIATAVQVSGIATGFAFVSGVFVQSGIATSVQVSGVATGFAFVSGVFVQSGLATAVQVSGIATGFAFVSGVFPASGFATSVQVSGILSGITQVNVSGVLIASGGIVPGLVSGVFVQSGIATSVQVSGIATGFAFVSGVFVQSGIATSVQVSGLVTQTNISGVRSFLESFLPMRLKKNVAFSNFPFFMASSGSLLPLTGATISGTVSLDGAAFANLTNSASETSDGWYKINFAAADLNADSVALKFAAAGARQRDITVITQLSG